MANLGFQIHTEINRPDRALIEAFSGIPVANIADNLNRICCVDSSIRPYNKAPLLGCAFTVRATMGDNLLFHKALDMAKPGDVLVIAGGGTLKRSYCGAIMASYAKSLGLAGFMIDGCIRDVEEIGKMDFPVYAKGVMPDGPYKNGPGEINVPVSFAGQVICPGDILVGDQDGVVVIRPTEAEEVLEKAKKQLESENVTLAGIAAGKGLPRPWVEKLLSEKGVDII